VTPGTYVAVFAAGLVTSLSPCTLSVLPLTLGYIGGYAGARGQADGVLFLRCATSYTSSYTTTPVMFAEACSHAICDLWAV